MEHPTRGLLVCLIFLHCSTYVSLAREERDIFSWFRGSDSKPDAIELSPSSSVLKVHRYNGVKIHPVPSAPIHVQSADALVELTPQNLKQLELLNRMSSSLPDGEELENYDFTDLLPYVELIPDDSLERIQFYVESKLSNKNHSKLLAIINWLKSAKEWKLKQVQQVIKVGANLVNKKKKAAEDALGYLKSPFSSQSTTPTPVIPPVPTYPFPEPLPPHFNPYGPSGISHQTLANLPSLSDVALSPNVGNSQQPSYSSSISQPSVLASKLSNNQYFQIQKPQLSLSEDISNDMSTYNLPSSFNHREQQYNSKPFGNYYSQPPVQMFVQHDQFADQPTHLQQSQIPSAIISSPPLSTNHRLPFNDQVGHVQVQQRQYPQTAQLFNYQIHQLQNQNIDAPSASTSSSSQPLNHRTIPDESQSFHSKFENKIAFDHRVPANTYLTNDLISSASENLEQNRQQTSKTPAKPANTIDIVRPETNLNLTTSSVTKLQEVGDGDVTRLHRITSNNPPVYVTPSEVTDLEYSPNVTSTDTR